MDKFEQAPLSQPEAQYQDSTSQDAVTNKTRLVDTLMESGQLVHGLKWPIFKRVLIGLFLAVLIPLTVTVLLTFVMTSQLEQFMRLHPEILNAIVRTVTMFVLLAIWVQMIVLGVRHTLGLPIYMEIINTECMRARRGLAQLLIILVVMNSLMNYLVPIPLMEHMVLKELLIIMGFYLIYWAITIPILLFAIPHIVMQKQKTGTALRLAYRHAALCWKKIIASYGTLYLAISIIVVLFIAISSYSHRQITLIILEAILLILSIWIIPLYVTLASVLFRDAYGLKSIREKVIS